MHCWYYELVPRLTGDTWIANIHKADHRVTFFSMMLWSLLNILVFETSWRGTFRDDQWQSCSLSGVSAGYCYIVGETEWYYYLTIPFTGLFYESEIQFYTTENEFHKCWNHFYKYEFEYYIRENFNSIRKWFFHDWKWNLSLLRWILYW